MNTALWIVQGILAAAFGMAGVMKATQPKEKLLKNMPWAEDFSKATLKFIDITELLTAIGLLVPMLTGIAPVLTPIAALGICAIMVLAAINVHLKRKEYSGIAMNAVLFLLAAFVAYGRY